jgi:hypothetical protein
MAALFNILIKKRIKNSFRLYKCHFFFSKPLVVTTAEKIFQKNLVFSSFSSKGSSLLKIFQKNIFTSVKNKFDMSRKRL